MGIVRFMTAGSVDDGKSTLIGRLFLDQGYVFQDQKSEVEKNLAKYTDGLKEERELGITIDVSHRYFEVGEKKFIVLDAPGHFEYTRNMVTAATHSDAVLILVDATLGVREQTRRHAWIAHWLGKKILFLVNKMDLVAYSEKRFRDIEADIRTFSKAPVMPISALQGEGLSVPSKKLSWWEEGTLISWLMELTQAPSEDFLFRVQIGKGFEVLGDHFGFKEIPRELWVNGQRLVRVEDLISNTGSSCRLRLSEKLSRGDLLTLKPFPETRETSVEFCYLGEIPSRTKKFRLRFHTREESVDVSALEALNLTKLAWEKNEVTELVPSQVYRGKVKFPRSIPVLAHCPFVLFDETTGHTVTAGFLNPRDPEESL